MIERTAASAAKSRTAPPAGPLSAPPKEIGESFAGAFGADGKVGAFGGAEDRVGATLPPGATGTSVGGTRVTPCGGTNELAADGNNCGWTTTACENNGVATDMLGINATAPRRTGATCARFVAGCRLGCVVTGVAASGAGAATDVLVGVAAATGAGVVGFAGAGSAGTSTVISVTLGPGVTVEGVATGACVFGATVTGGAGAAPFVFVVAGAPAVGVPLVVAGGGVGVVPSVGVVPVVVAGGGVCVVVVGGGGGEPSVVVVLPLVVVPPVGSVTAGDVLPSVGDVAVADVPSVVVEAPVAAAWPLVSGGEAAAVEPLVPPESSAAAGPAIASAATTQHSNATSVALRDRPTLAPTFTPTSTLR